MKDQDNHMHKTIGILGGGQLGKMLFYETSKMGIPTILMDKNREMPVGKIAQEYELGDFENYEDVIRFGSKVDVITIEIEKINVAALEELANMGKKVYPQPKIISLIQDKGLQKSYYKDNELPTSQFGLYDNQADLINDINNGRWSYPFVQKIRKGGYDGRGVQIIKSEKQLVTEGFKKDFLVEDRVEILKEISIITCSDTSGTTLSYDPVEMVFDPNSNILMYQLGPADITEEQKANAKDIAYKLTQELGIVGLLAIEMFIDINGQILINEIAPRPHNSGHHSIEACYCSQYENHIRAIYDLPLGSTQTIMPSLLINVLGIEGKTGPVKYEGISECLKTPGLTLHLYGKKITKPNRKMGHITIIGKNIEALKENYKLISSTFKATS